VLDEIVDMPPEIHGQAAADHPERALGRRGGSEMIPLDLRIIAMTNRDL
jgi:DNA-binding NtrC family response regulator